MFFNSIPSVSVVEASEHVHDANTLFIDVRTPQEYAMGHAIHARNLPLDFLDESDIHELRECASVYVICQSGGRSSAAVRELIADGVNAININGGTSAWRSARLPME